MSKSDQEETEITLEEIKHIMGDDFVHFEGIKENCFCRKCKDSVTTIVMYRAYLNPAKDIILRGQCSRCGEPVARFIEK